MLVLQKIIDLAGTIDLLNFGKNPGECDDTVEVLGYNEPYDGGGGIFFWLPFYEEGVTTPQLPDGAVENLGFLFDSLVPAAAGHSHIIHTGMWVRRDYFDEEANGINVKWFGANMSGTWDATFNSALAYAATYVQYVFDTDPNHSDRERFGRCVITIPRGVYNIASILVIPEGVTLKFEKGAILKAVTAGSPPSIDPTTGDPIPAVPQVLLSIKSSACIVSGNLILAEDYQIGVYMEGDGASNVYSHSTKVDVMITGKPGITSINSNQTGIKIYSPNSSSGIAFVNFKFKVISCNLGIMIDEGDTLDDKGWVNSCRLQGYINCANGMYLKGNGHSINVVIQSRTTTYNIYAVTMFGTRNYGTVFIWDWRSKQPTNYGCAVFANTSDSNRIEIVGPDDPRYILDSGTGNDFGFVRGKDFQHPRNITAYPHPGAATYGRYLGDCHDILAMAHAKHNITTDILNFGRLFNLGSSSCIISDDLDHTLLIDASATGGFGKLTHVGISFNSAATYAQKIKVEINTGAAWVTLLDQTDSTVSPGLFQGPECVAVAIGNSVSTIDQIRITLGYRPGVTPLGNPPTSDIVIKRVWAYSSTIATGMYLAVAGGVVYGAIGLANGNDTAAVNNSLYLNAGDNTLRWKDSSGAVRQISPGLKGSIAFTPGTLLAGACTTATVHCAGAAFGDFVICQFDKNLNGVILTGYVSDPVNVPAIVTCVFYNPTGGTVILAAGILGVRVSR